MDEVREQADTAWEQAMKLHNMLKEQNHAHAGYALSAANMLAEICLDIAV